MVRSALWSEQIGLSWDETPFRGGREWSRVVRPARAGEVPFAFATTIASLLKESQQDQISMLKIDIEKSELALSKLQGMARRGRELDYRAARRGMCFRVS